MTDQNVLQTQDLHDTKKQQDMNEIWTHESQNFLDKGFPE